MIKTKWVTYLLMQILLASCSINSGFPPGIYELKQIDAKTLILPVWFPEGDYLIASEFSYSELKSTIYGINLITNKTKIIASMDGEATAQALSPDGKSMAVSIQGSNNFSDGIWIFNVEDGSNSYIGAGQAAAWSPNSRQLAIFSCEQLVNGNSTLATLRLIDLLKNEVNVIFNKSNCFRLGYVSWSSDNNIAFSYSSQKDSVEDIAKTYIIDLSTREVWQPFGENSWSPSFSPTGEKLAFIKNYEITLSGIDGKCETTIKTDSLGKIGYVTWSPDGTRLAASGMGRIFILNLTETLGSENIEQSSSCP